MLFYFHLVQVASMVNWQYFYQLFDINPTIHMKLSRKQRRQQVNIVILYLVYI